MAHRSQLNFGVRRHNAPDDGGRLDGGSSDAQLPESGPGCYGSVLRSIGLRGEVSRRGLDDPTPRGARARVFPLPSTRPACEHIANCCLRVSDARALHAAFAGAGLPASPRSTPRLSSPVDQPWGFREFAVVDLDGNLLRCLEPLRAATGGGAVHT